MVAENGQNGSHKPHAGRKVTGKTLFPIGDVVCTGNASQMMRKHGVHPLLIIAMHGSGIWGDIPAEDAKLNEMAILTGDRIMSAYRFGPDTLWVITDAGHNLTTILLPEDY